MKWMGWGWEQLCEAPPEVIHEIIRCIMEEQEEIENRNNNR